MYLPPSPAKVALLGSAASDQLWEPACILAYKLVALHQLFCSCWIAAPSRPSSPEKFSVPHICAHFGPGGQLIKVIPNLPSEGQPALVEIHSMEVSMALLYFISAKILLVLSSLEILRVVVWEWLGGPARWSAHPMGRWVVLSFPVLSQSLLQHTPEQEEMRAFPGPLGKYVSRGLG